MNLTTPMCRKCCTYTKIGFSAVLIASSQTLYTEPFAHRDLVTENDCK